MVEEIKSAFEGIKTEIKGEFEAVKAENATAVDAVKSELEELKDKVDNNQKVVVVNGIGGIGKTTLAKYFIDKICESNIKLELEPGYCNNNHSMFLSIIKENHIVIWCLNSIWTYLITFNHI